MEASGAEDGGAAFSIRAQVRYTSNSSRRMPRRIIERYGSLAIALGRAELIAHVELVVSAHKRVMEKMSINLVRRISICH